MHELSIAGRTGKIINPLELEFAYDQNNPRAEHNYSGLVRVPVNSGLVLRAGAVRNDKTGLALGARKDINNPLSKIEKLTLNGDVCRFNDSTHAHGYASSTIPLKGDLKAYFSVGGASRDQKINNVSALWKDNGMGVLAVTKADLDDNEQSGKILYVPDGFTMDQGSFNFYSEVFNQTANRGFLTDNTVIGWAPFDGMRVDGKDNHSVYFANWENTPEDFTGSAGHAYRPNPNLLFGVTGKAVYDKQTKEIDPSISGEIYSTIPQTPFDAWLKLEHSLKTGETDATGYAGIVKSF